MSDTSFLTWPFFDNRHRELAEALEPWCAGSLPVDHRDADAALAKAYGIPDGYQFHGQVVHYPALVLLGPDGKEIFRYVGKNNGDRFSFDQLKAKLVELKKSSPAKK